MRKSQVIIITGLTLILVGFFCCSCCERGDNACYKAWYGLELHPTDPNRYTDPWERFLNPELRHEDDAGQGFWDWLFITKKQKIKVDNQR